ncbi:MAG TPA: flagellar filament capping protein FliD [Acidimicrobiales bacterium]|nr:flagellar filament capping protein FliD [Acidimicrobiales bacterium]
MTTSGTTSTGSSTSAPLIVNGLISGINTSSVISALLQAYQAPITNLQNEQTSLGGKAGDYGVVNTDLQRLMTAAQALSTSSSWNLATATSSDSAVASASASPGAQLGTTTFNVDQLAQGNILASQGGVASTGTVVTSAASLLLATGGEALGFSSFSSAGALALGSHTIDVTQSSSAATVTAATALPTSTTITTGTNDTLALSVGGTAYTLTLAAGTAETPTSVVAAINAAATTAGAGVTASLSSTGALQLSTNEQGSLASLSVTGGTALSTLGLSSGQAGTGTNGVVTVDGTSTTLTSIMPGATVSLAAPAGSITATVASAPGASGALLSSGSASADLVSTGSGSLSAVVAAINGASLGMTASAVQDSAGTYLLQVAANGTGLAGSASVDPTAFAGGALGSLNTISSAQNALVSVGGTGGYQLSSATDTFTNLLAGTAVSVAAIGQATVTVAPDATGEATQVSTLVSSANQVLADINQVAGYNAATKTGGPLMGSAVLQGIQQQVLSIFASAAGSSGLGNALSTGIGLTSTGSITFSQSTFESAFSANPTKVASLFAQGGTFAPSSSAYAGTVGFVYANDSTASGTYDVQISQSATQASDTGAALSSGTVSAAETLTIGSGGATANYTTTAGESLASIASGLDQQFAANGLGLSASVVNSGTQLSISSNGYGSATSFSVTSTSTASGTTGLGGPTAGTAASFTGTDVAGTINGVAATGLGQVLTAPSSDPTLAGLSLLVSTPGITSLTDLGSFSYTPGLAQQLQSLGNTASNPVNGMITTTISSLTNESAGLNSQISDYQAVATAQQTLLQNEFAKMETALGTLKNQAAALSSQIAQLP